MKKVLGAMSKFIFAGFGIAVLALLMSLTYGALQKLFPNSFSNQMWGLVMFDIAAMCWGIAFVFQSKSTAQYAVSAIGFIVAFVGTLGMVAAEVMLSGQNLATIDTGEIGKWMVYGFIIVTAIHAGLIYAHHASAPDIHEQINVGVARGEIVTEAIAQATKQLDTEKNQLAVTITRDIVSQVKRDLGLYPVTGTPFESKNYETYYPLPVTRAGQEEGAREDHPLSQRFRKWLGSWKQPAQTMENIAQTSNALVAWDTINGKRYRWWCKICRDEGKPWLWEPTCQHVHEAKGELQIPKPQAWATMEQFAREIDDDEPGPGWTQDTASTEKMSWNPDAPNG